MYCWESEKYKAQSLARSGGNFDRKAYILEEAANKLKLMDKKHFLCFCTY